MGFGERPSHVQILALSLTSCVVLIDLTLLGLTICICRKGYTMLQGSLRIDWENEGELMSVGFAYPSSGRLTPIFLEKPPLLCCWSSRGMWTGAGLNAHLRSGRSEHCITLESDGFGSGHANRSEPRRLNLRTPTRKYEKVPLDLLSS